MAAICSGYLHGYGPYIVMAAEDLLGVPLQLWPLYSYGRGVSSGYWPGFALFMACLTASGTNWLEAKSSGSESWMMKSAGNAHDT